MENIIIVTLGDSITTGDVKRLLYEIEEMYGVRKVEFKDVAAQQSAQADGAYCACNPNEAPYKVGSNLCAICEKPRR